MLQKNVAKELKSVKEVKVKKEPGMDEELLDHAKVGGKQKSAAKVDDQGPKQKLKKSCASSSASIISINDSHVPSLSILLIPTSSAVSNDDSIMDIVDPHPPINDAASDKQILAVLDRVLENAKGVMKGVKFLKKAIKNLRLVEDSDGTDV